MNGNTGMLINCTTKHVPFEPDITSCTLESAQFNISASNGLTNFLLIIVIILLAVTFFLNIKLFSALKVILQQAHPNLRGRIHETIPLLTFRS